MRVNELPTSISLKTGTTGRSALDFLEDRQAQFYHMGRNGVFWAVKALGASPADNILMPAYHCGVEVDAAVKAGIQAKFYRIKANTEADIQDIKSRIDDNTRALLLVHYFGFAQPVVEIVQLCRERNIMLIEDCAHALFSSADGTFLGSSGDFGIYSLWKSLPVPHGGALVSKQPIPEGVKPTVAPRDLKTVKALAGMMMASGLMHYPLVFRPLEVLATGPLKKLLRLARSSGQTKTGVANEPDYRIFDSSAAPIGMSPICRTILKRIQVDDVVTCRRHNFEYLLALLKDQSEIELIFDHLPPETCPLVFPVLVENRTQVQRQLLRRGISTFIFGMRPHDLLAGSGFPESTILARKNLGLPIHQDMTERQVTFVAAELAKAVESSRQ